MPATLLLHASEILSDPDRPAHRIPQRLAVILALCARGSTCDTWPIVPLSWRAMAHITGLSRSTLHDITAELEALDILHRQERPGPWSVNRFDLSPLQTRLAALDGLPRENRRRILPNQPPLLDLPGLPLSPRVVEDVITRAAVARAAALGKDPARRVRARAV